MLRSEQELIIQKVSTVLKGKNPLGYFGTITWNSIPGDIRRTKSNNEFQKMEWIGKKMNLGNGKWSVNTGYTKTMYKA